MKYLNELQSLNLPNGMFAISGSAPMAIRNIRPAKDIDIIVKNSLWKILIKKYPNKLNEKKDCLNIGNIEIYKNWLNLSEKIDEMIDSAEMFEGLPFVKLFYVQQWKKHLNREKDIKDLELITKYLQKK